MEQEKLRAMLEKHHTDAWGWALHCCERDRDEAEATLHTAYVSVLNGSASFGERSSFKTWLFGVIRTTAWRRKTNLWRRLRRLTGETAGNPSREPGLDAGIYRSELKEKVVEVLECLSRRQHQVLHLVFYQDLTIEEAASVLGISVGSARTHYHRGKQGLRQELVKRGLQNGYTG